MPLPNMERIDVIDWMLKGHENNPHLLPRVKAINKKSGSNLYSNHYIYISIF